MQEPNRKILMDSLQPQIMENRRNSVSLLTKPPIPIIIVNHQSPIFLAEDSPSPMAIDNQSSPIFNSNSNNTNLIPPKIITNFNSSISDNNNCELFEGSDSSLSPVFSVKSPKPVERCGSSSPISSIGGRDSEVLTDIEDLTDSDSSETHVQSLLTHNQLRGGRKRSESQSGRQQNSFFSTFSKKKQSSRQLNLIGKSTSRSRMGSTKSKGASEKRNNSVYMPTGLFNPFRLMDSENNLRVNARAGKPALSTGILPCAEAETFKKNWQQNISADLNEIRISGTQGVSRSAQFIPVKPSRASSPEKMDPDEYRKNQANDDFCSACLLKGKIMCCDSCPRTFHAHCLEEGFDHFNLPTGSWFCKVCKKGRQKMKKSKTNPLFDKLFESMDGMNPRTFELPTEIYESFENILKHPMTGDYMDTRKCEIQPLNANRTLRNKSTTTPLLLATAYQDLHFADANTMSPFDNNSLNINGISSNGSSSNTKKNHLDLCFHCSKSGIQPIYANLLNSYLLHRPSVDPIPHQYQNRTRIQADRSKLIKCEYCNLSWHLSCLRPILHSVPAALNEEPDVVDTNSIRKLKRRAWGDGFEGGGGELMDEKVGGGFYQIRSKWMCPCHVEWAFPEGPRVLKSVRWDNINNAIKNTETTEDEAYPPPVTSELLLVDTNPNASTPQPSSSSTSLKIVSTIESRFGIDTVKYKFHVQEERVKKEFFDKVKSQRDISLDKYLPACLDKEFLSSLGLGFSRGLAELYEKDSTGGLLTAALCLGSNYDAQCPDDVTLCSERDIEEWLEALVKLQCDIAERLKKIKNC